MRICWGALLTCIDAQPSMPEQINDALTDRDATYGLFRVGQQIASLLVEILWQFGMAEEGTGISLLCDTRGEITLPSQTDLLQHPLGYLGGQGTIFLR